MMRPLLALLFSGMLAFAAGCAGSGEPTPPLGIGIAPSPVVSRAAPPARQPSSGNSLAAEQDRQLGGTGSLPSALPQPLLGASAHTLPAQAALLSGTAIIRFAPVVGLPTEGAVPLATALQSSAREHGIGVTNGATTPTHVLKGYLSASGSGQTAYVWDITDANGARLHRIQGTAPGSANEPETLRAVAGRTIDEFASWITAPRG